MSTFLLLHLDIRCYNQDMHVSFCLYVYILQASSVYPLEIDCLLLLWSVLLMVITAYGLYCYNDILLSIDLLLRQRAV